MLKFNNTLHNYMSTEQPQQPEYINLPQLIEESQKLLPQIEDLAKSFLEKAKRITELNSAIASEQDPAKRLELKAEKIQLLSIAEAEKQQYIQMTNRMDWLLEKINLLEQASGDSTQN